MIQADVAMGAVLLQRNEMEELLPYAYTSQKLSDTKW